MSERLIAKAAGRVYRSNEVLRDVNVSLRAGEVLAIIGPNGGGKSTLLLMMAGLVRPTSGTVELDGVATSRVAVESTGSIGLITAVPGLYPALTGQENLEYFGGLYGLDKVEIARRGAPLIEELELEAALDRPAATYSSGMQQKLSLVRARLLDPKVLLLDEPTANLDPVSTDTIYRAMRAEADRGIALALVTHDLHAAEQLCDRVAVVKQTVLCEEVLDGERKPPPTGKLFDMYQRAQA